MESKTMNGKILIRFSDLRSLNEIDKIKKVLDQDLFQYYTVHQKMFPNVGDSFS